MRPISLVLIALVLLPSALHAQEREPVLGSDPMMGVHVGVPASLSFAIGGYQEYWRRDSTSLSPSRFWFVLVEPGADAGRVSVGIGDGVMAMDLITTYRVTALRVWREKVANYVGVEGAITFFGLTGRLGVFGRRGLGGPPPFRLGLDLGLFI